MNKPEYLNALEKALSGVPRKEVKKSLDFYAGILDDAVENGEAEEDAVSRLGSVEETARKIINEIPLAKLVRENVKKRHMSGAEIALIVILSPVWLSLAMAIFAVVVSLYLAIWAIAAVMFAICAGCVAGGPVLLATAPFIAASHMPNALLSLGMGLVPAGGAIFVFFAALLFSKLIIKLTGYTARKIKNGFARGEMTLMCPA